MHVMIIGAAGMIGRKLTGRLVRDATLAGSPVERLTLADIVAPDARRALPARWRARPPTFPRPAPPSGWSRRGRT